NAPTHSFGSGRTLRLRNATGPWSPCSISGPLAVSFFDQLLPVGVSSSWFSWITWPLSVALTTFALAVFSPFSLRCGERQTTSSGGGVSRGVLGGFPLGGCLVAGSVYLRFGPARGLGPPAAAPGRAPLFLPKPAEVLYLEAAGKLPAGLGPLGNKNLDVHPRV